MAASNPEKYFPLFIVFSHVKVVLCVCVCVSVCYSGCYASECLNRVLFMAYAEG